MLYTEFCDENVDEAAQLSDLEWKQLQVLTQTLEPIYTLTQKLQREQLFFGDFFKLWLEQKLIIKAMPNEQSGILVDCLEKREKVLISNEVIVSTIYLDPRIRRILTSDQLQVAKMNLVKLFRQIFAASKNVSAFVRMTFLIANLDFTTNPIRLGIAAF